MNFRTLTLVLCDLALLGLDAHATPRKPLVLNSGQQQQLQSGDTLTDASGNPYGFGTVTSVGLSLPAQYSCSGSPITTSGTITCGWTTETANTVLAGPTSGAAAAPTFRSFVSADFPASLAFTTPNIGAATGTSLTFSGNGPLAFNTHSSLCDNGAGIIEVGASAACGTGGTIDANLGYFSILANRNSTHIWESTTAPTVTSGLGTSPTVGGNGAWSIVLTVGSSGAPSATEVLGMPTATAGWNCTATDRTTNVTARETATTTTSVTFTWSSAPSNSDVIQHQCVAY